MELVWVFILIIADINSAEGIHCNFQLASLVGPPASYFLPADIVILAINYTTAQVDQVVHVPGDRATFPCSQSHDLLPGVQWLVNGSALESLNLSNVTELFSDALHSGVLVFTALSLEYNVTSINCRATTTLGMMISTDALLLMQGLKKLY